MAHAQRVQTIDSSGRVKTYNSQRAASRCLSGNGTDVIRPAISAAVRSGGDYVGTLWVQGTTYPGVLQHRDDVRV